jgi:hypothetical protein
VRESRTPGSARGAGGNSCSYRDQRCWMHPIQRTPSAPCEPSHIAIPTDVRGLRIREWLDLAKAAMDGKSGEWRRRWLELHQQELADRVEAAAIAPDLPQEDAA